MRHGPCVIFAAKISPFRWMSLRRAEIALSKGAGAGL